METFHAAGTEKDYVNTLTNLFKDIALAIDENEGFVGNAFGPEAVLTLISGLQQVQWLSIGACKAVKIDMRYA